MKVELGLKANTPSGFAWKWKHAGCLIMGVSVDAIERLRSGQGHLLLRELHKCTIAGSEESYLENGCLDCATS